MKRFLLAGALLALGAAGAAEEGAGQALFLKVDPSVVFIRHEAATGSGFIVSPDGYILSNGHVVMSPDMEEPKRVAKRITVQLSNDREYPARVVGHCLDPDVSLIKIELAAGEAPLQPVVLGDSSSVRVGQPCYAFGAPQGLKRSLTSGIISNADRTDMGTYVPIFQMDAAINPGNSGGPLFNEQGEVIGINTYGGGGDGLAFSIPINAAKVLREHYLRYGHFRRSALGTFLLQPVDEKMGKALGVDGGALISHVVPGSSAEEAGLRAGDVIRALDGKPVSAKNEAERLLVDWDLSTREIGSRMTLEIRRGKETVQILAVLGEADPLPRALALRIQGMEHGSGEIPHHLFEGLGFAVQQVYARSRLIFNLSEAAGVLVTQVQPGSAAQRAGMGQGDLVLSIEGRPTPDPEAFREALEAGLAARRKTIRLELQRGKETLRTALAPHYALAGKRVALLGAGDWKEVVRRHLVEGGAEIVQAPVADASGLDGVVFVGGPDLAGDGEAAAMVQALVAAKKVVAALGGAPAGLLKADPSLLGRKMTVSQDLAQEVMDLKANYTGKAVEKDGRLVTGTGLDRTVAREFCKALFRALAGGGD